MHFRRVRQLLLTGSSAMIMQDRKGTLTRRSKTKPPSKSWSWRQRRKTMQGCHLHLRLLRRHHLYPLLRCHQHQHPLPLLHHLPHSTCHPKRQDCYVRPSVMDEVTEETVLEPTSNDDSSRTNAVPLSEGEQRIGSCGIKALCGIKVALRH